MTTTPSQATKAPDGDPLSALDELTFMRECAARMNAFIHTYPEEAQRVLRAFIPYEHELAEVHERMLRRPGTAPPGVTFGALYAAVLQTHHGTGYYLAPVIDDDRIVRLEVRRQGDDESAAKKD
jgi:hypothetical protein